MKKVFFMISFVLFSTLFFSCENDDVAIHEQVEQQQKHKIDVFNTGDDDDDDLELLDED